MALRPKALRWPDWIQAQIGKIERALDALELECQGFDDRVTMAQIAFGAAERLRRSMLQIQIWCWKSFLTIRTYLRMRLTQAIY